MCRGPCRLKHLAQLLLCYKSASAHSLGAYEARGIAYCRLREDAEAYFCADGHMEELVMRGLLQSGGGQSTDCIRAALSLT
mmetsp:Transcript_61099/g.134370  ORF Transcript_61099/g.134370 Transcript_61099/m.134370 type:complete len:81 (+) Transcript_61099:40-282(+)